MVSILRTLTIYTSLVGYVKYYRGPIQIWVLPASCIYFRLSIGSIPLENPYEDNLSTLRRSTTVYSILDFIRVNRCFTYKHLS